MSTHLLLLLLLLLLVCSALCLSAHSAGDGVKTQSTSTSVEIFKINEEMSGVIKPKNGETESEDTENITPKNFYSPLIVAANNVMVALTGVNRTDDNDNKQHVDILTKYITTKERDNWIKKVINDAKVTGWQRQFAFQENEQNQQNKNVVKGIAAAAKESKIYLLLLNETENGGSDQNCGIKLVEATVNENEKETSKMIKWVTKTDVGKSVSDELKKQFDDNPSSKYLLVSTVFLEKNRNILFVVHGTGKDDNNKNKFVFISLDDTTEDNEVKLSYKGTVESNCYSAFFPWENKIMMIPTNCKNSENKLFVNESSDMGETWTESAGLFDYFLDFMRDKKDFTATTINGSNILLFTQQKQKEGTTADSGPPNKYDVYVWFTDGNRVSSAGRIVTKDNITSSNLLHTKGELFALHQNIKVGTPENVTLTRMEEQLKNITIVIKAWKKSDAVVMNLFKDYLISLPTFSPTDGLVGFLFDNENTSGSDKYWHDEYYYVNATVNGGTKVDNGYNFGGKNKGAKWPVGKSKEDQPYNFTDSGFTLLANVTIDAAAASDKGNSVLGVVYKENGNGDEKTVGLLCTSEGQWKVTGTGGSPKNIVSDKVKCQRGSAYLVVFLLKNNKLSVYIDGKELGVKKSNEMKIEKTHNITHFYFGADASETSQNDIESHVTVRNVLLYNRPFTEEKVEKLKIPKERKVPESSNDSLNDTKNNDERNTQGGNEGIKGSSSDNDVSPSQSSRSGEVEKKSTSQPESSTVRGGYVGLFVCFVILAHALCFL